MGKARVLEIYGLDGSITGIKFMCKCGKVVVVEKFLCMGDTVECPYCGRRYRYELWAELHEVAE